MAGSEEPAPVVVCDAGPLIHLDQVGCVDLLHDFAEVLVPPIVREEVMLHRSTALSGESEKFVRANAIKPPSVELEALSRLLALHRGELEALQVAEARPGCILLTDDTAARLAGRSLGLVVHGTLGILVRAIRRKQRTKDEILVVLRSLPTKSTLHLRSTLLEEVCRQVEQSQ
jgi:predicted nucleic acid-binding protein